MILSRPVEQGSQARQGAAASTSKIQNQALCHDMRARGPVLQHRLLGSRLCCGAPGEIAALVHDDLVKLGDASPHHLGQVLPMLRSHVRHRSLQKITQWDHPTVTWPWVGAPPAPCMNWSRALSSHSRLRHAARSHAAQLAHTPLQENLGLQRQVAKTAACARAATLTCQKLGLHRQAAKGAEDDGRNW